MVQVFQRLLAEKFNMNVGGLHQFKSVEVDTWRQAGC